MDVARKLTVTVYDALGRRQGWVANYVKCDVTECHNARSFGELTVSTKDPMLPKLLAPGAQVQVFLARRFDSSTPEVFDNQHRLIAAKLSNPRGSLLASGTVTFSLRGHWRLFQNFVTWVNPDEELEASTLTDRAQSWDGNGITPSPPPPAGEDSGRWGYLQLPTTPMTAAQLANLIIDRTVNTRWASRFGEPAINTPYGPAGPIVTTIPQMRFQPVENYLVPILEQGNLSLRPVLSHLPDADRRFRLEANYYLPHTWAQTFTPESGVVADGDWSLADPTATDIILGGPGELSARAFRGYSDVALSIAQHDMIEIFRDATGAPLVWPDSLEEKYRIAKYYLLRPDVDPDRKAAFAKFLDDAGAEALAEGAPTSGVSVQLAESEGFRFTGADGDGRLPRGFATGDIVTVAPSTAAALEGLKFTARITQTNVTQSIDEGFKVTPQIGERKDDPDVQLALAVKRGALANSRRSSTQ